MKIESAQTNLKILAPLSSRKLQRRKDQQNSSDNHLHLSSHFFTDGIKDRVKRFLILSSYYIKFNKNHIQVKLNKEKKKKVPDLMQDNVKRSLIGKRPAKINSNKRYPLVSALNNQ